MSPAQRALGNLIRCSTLILPVYYSMQLRQKPSSFQLCNFEFVKANLLPKVLFLVLILLSACSSSKHQYQFLVFGTLVELQIYEASTAKADAANLIIEKTFSDLHKTWHAWNQGGLLAEINQAIAGGRSITLAPDVIKFLQKIKKLSLQSENKFNPAIGRLVALWGFHREQWQGPPPSEEQLALYIKPMISMRSIEFNNNVLTSGDDRIQIDLGAVAKGYALDLAMTILKEQGIENAVVNAGGDLQVLGQKNHRAWHIGIKSPKGGTVGSIRLKDGESAASSGDYERKFVWQGKSYHHVINPATGKPAQGIRSVTVIDNNAMRADVAATALLVAGKGNWQSLANRMGVAFVLVVDDEQNVHMSRSMQARVVLDE